MAKVVKKPDKKAPVKKVDPSKVKKPSPKKCG